MFHRIKQLGFTLVEMMLVLVVVSGILIISMRYMQIRTEQVKIDRAAIQFQQILNAAMAYYVNNGTWPGTVGCLAGNQGGSCQVPYLPPNLKTPWGETYNGAGNPNEPYYVWVLGYSVGFDTAAKARLAQRMKIIAGLIPSGYTTVESGNPPPPPGYDCGMNTWCSLVASVNVPSQAFDNNKGLVNFAGLYHHGGCVPVPACPSDTTAQIYVVPVQIAGTSVSDSGDTFPITGFSAYAMGPGAIGNVPNCKSLGGSGACSETGSTAAAQYWRVCSNINTSRGMPQEYGNTTWGQWQVLMAITRCSPNTESSGSAFTVYTR